MENKINIAKLLKDCSSGMELDCTMYEDVYFDYVDELNYIRCYIQQKFNKMSVVFNQDGTPNSHTKSKCVIFPKGKTAWEGFAPPCKFKAGDVLYVDCADEESDGDLYKYIFILKEIDSLGNYFSYCYLSIDRASFCSNFLTDNRYTARFATEEEKAKLFQAIKDNGYKWNEETKTLEKLIEPNKFDINTLIPFESKVLVRDSKDGKWRPAYWGFYDKDKDNAMNYPYECCGNFFSQCIPYEGNEHLLGKTDDCDEFYKTWE